MLLFLFHCDHDACDGAKPPRAPRASAAVLASCRLVGFNLPGRAPPQDSAQLFHLNGAVSTQPANGLLALTSPDLTPTHRFLSLFVSLRSPIPLVWGYVLNPWTRLSLILFFSCLLGTVPPRCWLAEVWTQINSQTPFTSEDMVASLFDTSNKSNVMRSCGYNGETSKNKEILAIL